MEILYRFMPSCILSMTNLRVLNKFLLPNFTLKSILILVLSVIFTSSYIKAEVNVKINLGEKPIGTLNHFWRNTGFSSSSWIKPEREYLSEDEKFNLIFIASLPRQSINHVRIHWLLNLIKVRDSKYDFSLLDKLISLIMSLNLSPSFELMGNPGQQFTDLSNKIQAQKWKEVIKQLTIRYIEIYGIANVSKWQFETWNEPDLKMYNVLNFSVSSFISYFNATAEGVLEASNGILQIGAPAGLFKTKKNHPLCWGLLKYCSQTPCRLSFLSFHKKGNRAAEDVINGTISLAKKLYEAYPQLSSIPFSNDESDPLSGWWKDESWRMDVRYASMVTHIIIGLHKLLVQHNQLPFGFISNDNGFLSSQPFSFSQRTLLARFQMNDPRSVYSQFFRKPVYVVMALLSLLGNDEMSISVSEEDTRLSIIAAKTDSPIWNIGILISFSNDTQANTSEIKNITLAIEGFQFLRYDNFTYCIYVLNNNETNPSAVWQNAGSPIYPNADLRKIIREREGPSRIGGVTFLKSPMTLKISIPLTLPSIALLHLCSLNRNSPPVGQVTNLRALNITFNEVLLIWNDNYLTTKCIKTFEIEFMPHGLACNKSCQFERINSEDFIFLCYQHAFWKPDSDGEEVTGYYRVRAIDYWGRPGDYSEIIEYPTPPVINYF